MSCLTPRILSSVFGQLLEYRNHLNTFPNDPTNRCNHAEFEYKNLVASLISLTFSYMFPTVNASVNQYFGAMTCKLDSGRFCVSVSSVDCSVINMFVDEIKDKELDDIIQLRTLDIDNSDIIRCIIIEYNKLLISLDHQLHDSIDLTANLINQCARDYNFDVLQLLVDYHNSCLTNYAGTSKWSKGAAIFGEIINKTLQMCR